MYTGPGVLLYIFRRHAQRRAAALDHNPGILTGQRAYVKATYPRGGGDGAGAPPFGGSKVLPTQLFTSDALPCLCQSGIST